MCLRNLRIILTARYSCTNIIVTLSAEVGDEDDDDVEDDEEDDDDEGDDEEEEVPGGPTMADLMSGKYVRTKYPLFLSLSVATC